MTETIVFYLFGAVGVAASFLMVTRRNAVSSALALVVTLFCVAVLFLAMQASLVAILQVMVYAGAIMVLFVFVIMLLNLPDERLSPVRVTPVLLLGGAVVGYLVYALIGAVRGGRFTFPAIDESFGTVSAVAKVLFTKYLLPFEVASVLLLIAIIGAVLLAKKEIEP